MTEIDKNQQQTQENNSSTETKKGLGNKSQALDDWTAGNGNHQDDN